MVPCALIKKQSCASSQLWLTQIIASISDSGDGICIGGEQQHPKEPNHTPFKTMTDFNSATRDQHFVHEIETDAEFSLDQLAEINGSGFFDFMIKATKVGGLASGTASFGFKGFNKYFRFLKGEQNPKTRKLNIVLNKTGNSLWDKLWTAD